MKAADAPDPAVLEAALPPVVPEAPEPEVAVAMDMALEISLARLPEMDAMAEVPLPARAVTVALTAELADEAIATRVLLAPATALLAALTALARALLALATGAGMPAGPVVRKPAAVGCVVTGAGMEVMTDG